MALGISIGWGWQAYVFIFLTLFWWAEFVLFPSYKRSGNGQGTFYLIMTSILLSVALAFLFNWFRIGVLESEAGRYMTNTGLVIYALGLVLRYTGILQLGKNFSRGTEAVKEQELISWGLYSRLRHPLYLGLFLLTLGVPLILQTYSGALFTTLVMFYSLNRRMAEEEELMESILGDRYRHWKEDRYRFLPYIY